MAGQRVDNWFNALRYTISRRGVNLSPRNKEGTDTIDLEDAIVTPAGHEQLINIVKNLKEKTGKLYTVLSQKGGRNSDDYIEELLTFLETLLSENEDIHAGFNDLQYSKDKKFSEELPMSSGIRTWIKNNAQQIYNQFLQGNPYAFANALMYTRKNLPRASIAESLQNFTDVIEQKPDEFSQKIEEYKTSHDELITESINLLKIFMAEATAESPFSGYEFYSDKRLVVKKFKDNATSDQQLRDVLTWASRINPDFLLTDLVSDTKSFRNLIPLLRSTSANELVQSITRMTQAKFTVKDSAKRFGPAKKTGVGPEIERRQKIDYAQANIDLAPQVSQVAGESQDDIRNKKIRALVAEINTSGSVAERRFNEYLRERALGSLEEYQERHFTPEIASKINEITSIATRISLLYQMYATDEDEEPLNIYQEIPTEIINITEDNIIGAGNGIKNIIIIMRKMGLNEEAAELVSKLTNMDLDLDHEENDSFKELGTSITNEKMDKFLLAGDALDEYLLMVLEKIQLKIASELNKTFAMLDPVELRTSSSIPKKGKEYIDEWLSDNNWLYAVEVEE